VKLQDMVTNANTIKIARNGLRNISKSSKI
jgi:hypothetical protein